MMVRDCLTLLDDATPDIHKARLLAVKGDHGSECNFALPISACGLHISNEVSIAISHRLGLNICEPHCCPCGGVVDAKGIYGLLCKRSECRSIRHQQINHLVWCVLRRADTPSVKEPSGLLPGEVTALH